MLEKDGRGERGGEKEGEREMYKMVALFFIFKRNDGCLGTFSYLVFNRLARLEPSYVKPLNGAPN
jgi:hypothetical protein